jgi:hypothetical protein
MSNSHMLQVAARRSRDEFLRTAAELRARLTPAEVAKDIAAQIRSHPTSLNGQVRPSAGQVIISTVAVLALARLLEKLFGHSPGRSGRIKSQSK